jgi:hypothetical protein|tara:strand:- start:81771 stop:83120 length:1350 start_codon:yes stop_codon:yes gene_type:complete
MFRNLLRIKFSIATLMMLFAFSANSQSCTPTPLESNLYSPSKIITCDFNGDNLEDIVFLDSASYYLYWKRNLGGDQYSAAIPLVGGAEFKFLTSGDMNNDNFDELLFATSTDLYYVAYLTATTIDFQNLFSPPPFYYFSALEMGDFNNDGSFGFVMAYHRASTLRLIIDVVNNTNGSLAVQNIEDIYSGDISDLVVGDITGNNRPDIATTGYSILWYRNAGNGTFGPNRIIASATGQFGRIELMDYDNDNRAELINLNSGGSLRTYEIDITNGGLIYSPVTIMNGLPTTNPVWEKVTRNGIEQILIKKVNSLVALENIGNTFSQNVLCTNMSGLNGITLLKNANGSTDFCYTDVTAGKVNRLKISSLSVEKNSIEGLNIYPNPSSGIFEIDSETDLKDVKIFNALGQVCQIEKIGANTYSIQNLDNGVYQLRVEDNNGSISVQSLVKTY